MGRVGSGAAELTGGGVRDWIDLRSDTVTRPGPAMRAAIAAAEVGDDALGDDPTTRRLEERMAELLGVEAALFFPSGVMANQAALAVIAEAGTEVLLGRDAHILRYEEAAAAALSGLQLHPVEDGGGEITVETLDAALSGRSRYRPRVSALALENTHLESGGTVFGADRLIRVAEYARDRGLAVHLDGARLWNAAAATGAPLSAWTAQVDTVMVSLSKGLGAPVGSVLGAGRDRIDALWRVRRRLGGAMRQSGLLAAAALYAIDHLASRIPEDHENARRLAAGIDALDGFSAPPPRTNIVIAHTPPGGPDPEEVVAFLRGHRILMMPFGSGRVRAVTHLDVDSAKIHRVLGVLAEVDRARDYRDPVA